MNAQDGKMSDANRTATLLINNKQTQMPVRSGSIGPEVIDIRPLYAKSGMFTYDPGFLSTASCDSKITYIDGDEGVLLYRGYNIAELAEQSDFMECCYLLMNGELPSKQQKDKFVKDISHHTMVHEQISTFYRGYPIDQLAEHGDFLETCYLLLYGELPTAAQKADFDYRVTRRTMVREAGALA